MKSMPAWPMRPSRLPALTNLDTCLSFYKETIFWLLEIVGDDDFAQVASKSIHVEISPLHQNASIRYLRILLPLYISHGEALPTQQKCQYTLLAFSQPLSDDVSSFIFNLSEKRRNSLSTVLSLHALEIACSLIDSVFSNDPTSLNQLLLEIIESQAPKTMRKKICYRQQFLNMLNRNHSPGLSENYSSPQLCCAATILVAPTRKSRKLASLLPGQLELPPIQTLKKYCQHLRQWFYEYYLFNVGKASLTSPHMGWVDFRNSPYYYGMKLFQSGHFGTTTAQYPLLCSEPSLHHGLSDILNLAPHEITFPLFSYVLFAVLKPFISGYPARMSDDEKYRIVQKKLQNTIYLTVDGTSAHQFSKLFCELFQVYDKVYQPVYYKQPKSTTAQCVHDGIVIYEQQRGQSTRKISKDQLPQFLLHDACSLFLDAELPKDPRAIRVHIPPEYRDVFHDDATLVCDMNYFVREFAQYIMESHRKESIENYQLCCTDLFSCFRAHYLHVYTLLPKAIHPLTNEELDELSAACFPKIPFFSFQHTLYKLTDPFAALDVELLKKDIVNTPQDWSEAAIKIAASKSNRHKRVLSIPTGRPTDSAYEYAEFYCEAQEIYNQYCLKWNLSLVDYPAALSLLKKKFGADKGKAKNYAYLLAAFLAFTKSLDDADSANAELLRQEAIQTFQALSSCQSSPSTKKERLDAISAYLSAEIEQGHLIAVRGDPPTEGEATGWYDGKKGLIYLPHDRYFARILSYCTNTARIRIPPTKREFQEHVLYSYGLISTKSNGTKSAYQRPDCKIVVAPIGEAHPMPETVIKLSLGALEEHAPLSSAARSKLQQMQATAPPRRCPKTCKWEEA